MTDNLKKLQSYIWRTPKNYNNNKVTQNEVKLIDASETDLQKYYNHCQQMLYNESADRPGRYVLLKEVNHQRCCCNAELFVRHLRTNKISQTSYLIELRNLINNNKDYDFKNVFLEDFEDENRFPADFYQLTVENVMDACLDHLGRFDKSHITLAFILKQGIWFTEEESDRLFKSVDTSSSERPDIILKNLIKEELNLPNIELRSNPKGLTYSQFRAMVQLKSNKYSELTTEQLITLRDRTLFALEDDIEYHIKEWEIRKKQIIEIADYKSFKIDE